MLYSSSTYAKYGRSHTSWYVRSFRNLPEEIYVVVQVRIWRASHEILIVLILSIDHVDGVVCRSVKTGLWIDKLEGSILN